MTRKEALSLATFNCKNIKSSTHTIQKLLEGHDIILIQETWLFKYENSFFKDTFHNIGVISKQIDDDSPIPPIQKPRGYGGSAIVWHEKLDPLISQIPDGSNRILGIRLLHKPKDILILNAYMPCKGQKTSLENYKEVLDEIHEIVTKYTPTCEIILGGDLNAQIFPTQPDKQDQLLKNFCTNHQILPHKQHPQIPTFINHLGADSTQIDYILSNTSKVTEITVMNELELNTSDHHPVSATTSFLILGQVTPHPSYSTDQPDANNNSRINWNKVDLSKYESLLDDEFREKDVKLDTKTDVEQAINNFHIKLNTAAKQAAMTSACKSKKKNKGKNTPVWNQAIKQACTLSKQANHEWKLAGRPSEYRHKAVQHRKHARRILRQEIRKENARRRDANLESIMTAHTNNKDSFYKLIKKQRNVPNTNPDELIVSGKSYHGEGEICEGWKEHFEKLATPSTLESYNASYHLDTQFDNLLLKDSREHPEVTFPLFTYQQITKAILKLNTNKAPDIHGLSAEHLRNATPQTIGHLLLVFNAAAKLEHIPREMKTGVLTPVYKNKKDKSDPFSYRGITVTAVTGKTLEILLRDRITPTLSSSQSPLQAGFTTGASPLNAAFLIQETINYAKLYDQTTYIALLDAKTAFDVVSHPSINRKLYHDGIQGPLWRLLANLQEEAYTKIKWGNKYSTPFLVQQGVRQGGILSTELYKRYNNTLLTQLEQSLHGAWIGSIHCPAPTCADDIALVATSPMDLQILINMVDEYSKMERYELQAAKSLIVPVKPKVPLEILQEIQPWRINDSQIQVVPTATHLGMQIDTITGGMAGTIDTNISKARRALYSLMGAGLHGKNGLSPSITISCYNTYILPILIYGLDVLLPNDSELKPASELHRKLLLQLCSLANNVALPTPYILAGMLPLQAIVHKRALMFLFNLIKRRESLERKIVERQLIFKEKTSWVTRIRSILVKYDLPQLETIMDTLPLRTSWTSLVNKRIDEVQAQTLVDQASLYTSLRYLNIDSIKFGHCHLLLRSVRNNTADVYRYLIKIRLATGTYQLQSNRRSFNQTKIDPTCLLCNQAPETRTHFISECTTLVTIRKMYMESCLIPLPSIPEDLIGAILDTSNHLNKLGLDLNPSLIQEQELWSRRYCYAIHAERSRLMATLPTRRRFGLGKQLDTDIDHPSGHN